jgi:nudix motif 8
MPLCHNKGVPSILFTTRTEKVSRHKGQICFPGGMVDDTDLSINDTALRELDEELGISSDRVEVLGKSSLSPISFLSSHAYLLTYHQLSLF